MLFTPILRVSACRRLAYRSNVCHVRHYSLLNAFRKNGPPEEFKPTSHLPWEERDNSGFLMRLTIALVGTAGLAVYGMWKFAGPDSPVAEEVGLVLNPHKWTQAMVMSTESTSPDTKLITLAIPRPYHPKITDKYRPIWSLYVKDDDIMVERPYTPLTGFDKGGLMQLWVKKYEHGEVGRWLHNKNRGDVVEVRAPLRTWEPDEDLDELVMISGGTGVTPFFQLFTLYIKNPNIMPNTKFTLLHSARTPADLLPPSLLEQMKDFAAQYPDRFKLKLFVESDPKLVAHKNPDLDIQFGRIGKKDIQWTLRSADPWYRQIPFLRREEQQEEKPYHRQFLVCGPSPMIAAIAGPYGRNFSQGPIGGHLKELGFQSKDVYKL